MVPIFDKFGSPEKSVYIYTLFVIRNFQADNQNDNKPEVKLNENRNHTINLNHHLFIIKKSKT